MSDAHRQYELSYVISPTIADEGVEELHEKISEIIRQLGGTVDKTEIWGRRRLAYEINRHREGIYVIALLTGPADMVRELERRLRVMEQLLRHLVIRVDEVLRKAEHKRTSRQSRQERRRAARAIKAGVSPAAPAAAAVAEPAVVAAPAAATEPAAAAAEAPAEASAAPVAPESADAPGEPETSDAPPETVAETDEEQKS